MASRKVLVLGATGPTGQHVVAQALERGDLVTAFVRNPDALTVSSERLRVVTGDVTKDEPALATALRGQDVVISALGRGKSFKSLGLIAASVPRIVQAMEREGIRRIVFLSAFGIGDTHRDTPWLPRLFMATLLRDVYRDKSAGEAVLRRSSLDWTIVYPTGLTDRPATGQYRVGTSLPLRGFPTVARADVATFLVTQIEDTKFLRAGVLISAS
jgi:putative NADH-flavin reductase